MGCVNKLTIFPSDFRNFRPDIFVRLGIVSKVSLDRFPHLTNHLDPVQAVQNKEVIH